ncbi:uncharacterized protein [Oryza sativa Japonica Group]|uniref:Os12g0299600 protein n=2 Tax=Oryza sativa subsp. japonica TaxID=39947 RepID=A0A0P0Y9B7_ORYSJ|nr:Os12g0299600 [Oryza sativa Japonica Group]
MADEIKRRREEDDDMMLFIFPAMYMLCGTTNSEKIPRHISRLSGKERLQEILEGHVMDCKVAFRMEPHVFKTIANYLREEKLLKDSRGLRIEEKLGIFMFMLAHNASFQDLQYEFKHSGSTLHRHIKSIFKIIPALTYRFLKLPHANQTHWKIRTNPRFFPYFKNCIGAIDGTHIPITIDGEKAAPYRNRKGTLSQNVMVACDFDLNFTFISCGWEGSATDARVLRSAMNSGFQVPNGKFFLVDGGYANTPQFIAPYRGVRYHLKEFGRGHRRPRDYKELFNHRHAILRNHVERALGVLKKRFPILKVGTFHRIKNQVRIPAAAAVFHNMIRLLNGDEGWLDNQPDNIEPTNFVDLPEGDSEYQNDVPSLSNQMISGNNIRDMIAKKMWEDYVRN